MDHLELLHRLGIALAAGLLVGVERHWREREGAPGTRTAGIRSFAVVGLVGGLAGALSEAAGREASALLLGLIFLGVSGAMLALRLREAAAEANFSVTGVLAAQATFAIGALAVLGDPRAAGAAAVALTALLAARETLHEFVARLRWVELRSAILLLSMTLLVLPLVPDRRFTVLGGLNPAQVWRFAILLASVSFVGYLAVRALGPMLGRLAAGAATGLVSSTAATLALARQSREEGTGPAAPAAGALVAGAVAWLRTAALAWWIAPPMARLLLPALVAGAAAQAAAALLLARGTGQDGGAEIAPRNPFQLARVMELALVLAAVALASELAAARFGGIGIGVVAAVTGLADVDAVTLSMGGLARESLRAGLAAQAVGIAVFVNTVAKTAYAFATGSRAFAWRFAAGSAAAIVAAALLLLLA